MNEQIHGSQKASDPASVLLDVRQKNNDEK